MTFKCTSRSSKVALYTQTILSSNPELVELVHVVRVQNGNQHFRRSEVHRPLDHVHVASERHRCQVGLDHRLSQSLVVVEGPTNQTLAVVSQAPPRHRVVDDRLVQCE